MQVQVANQAGAPGTGSKKESGAQFPHGPGKRLCVRQDTQTGRQGHGGGHQTCGEMISGKATGHVKFTRR